MTDDDYDYMKSDKKVSTKGETIRLTIQFLIFITAVSALAIWGLTIGVRAISH